MQKNTYCQTKFLPHFDPLKYHAKSDSFAAKLMGIHDLARIRMKARYLLSNLNVYLCVGDGVSMVWANETVDELLDLFKPRKIVASNNGITSDMIEQARSYPIESLIQFINGKAKAFCHNDSKPSLSWFKKGNAAKCFVCDKSFNPISLLMERDGMTFIQAVKHLC